MLELGSVRARLCGGMTRRSLLRIGSLGLVGGWSMADALRLAAQSPGNVRPKSAIILWLWGGPSHIDLFDLKPQATIEYRGPYEPISTSVPGIQIGELMPKLAQRMHNVSLIRSMTTGSQDHGVAGTIGLTGSSNGAVDLGGGTASGSLRPATGSLVAKVRGFQTQSLPPYVILGNLLHQGKKKVVGEAGGTLGSVYDPFRLNYTLEKGIEIPDVALPPGISSENMAARWELLKRLDANLRPKATPAPIGNLDRYYDLAMSLISSGTAREVLKIEKEPAPIRESYGMTRFGQNCLLARRLVESGIPYVQVNWSTHVEPHEDAGDGGWDMHDRNFQQLQDRHSWILDRALAGLIDDLRQRGLWDSTVIVAIGEFGRTPKINNKAGRDHWPNVYTALIGGGGIRGGMVIGSSDKQAAHVQHRPVQPADLSATVLECLGIGTTQLTSLNLLPQGKAVEELL